MNFPNLKQLILEKDLQDKSNELNMPLFEMANLAEKKTGIVGFIFISTKMASYAPRVKYYKQAGDEQFCFSVLITDTPKTVAIHGMKEHEVNKIESKVFEFIKLNKDKLLDFWNNGNTWDSDKLTEFLNSFEKV